MILSSPDQISQLAGGAHSHRPVVRTPIVNRGWRKIKPIS